MTNPNNCETCDYKKLNGNQEGWCYMFVDEPTDVCMAHSGRKANRFMLTLGGQPLGADFSRILNDNLWDLYEK